MTDWTNEQGSSRSKGTREIHAPGFGEESAYGTNRSINRPPTTEQSESGLVSRDYHPRTGGPELITSWPLGPAPSQNQPGEVMWTLENTEYCTIHSTLFQLPYLGPVDYNKIYLNVRGRGRVENKNTRLSLRVSPINLSGKPYEAEIEITNTESEPFITQMAEVAPDGREYGEHEFIGKEMYSGYELDVKVDGEQAYLHPGTAVQLWSE